MEQHLERSSILERPLGHEQRDANVRPIVLTGIGLALSLAAVGVIVYGILRYLDANPPTRVQANPMAAFDAQIPPAPRIEEHPAIEIEQLHAQEDQILATYGWIDKSKGVIRIPIDRAMEIQLERGFPTRKEPTQK
jgi:hypothetical protein